MIIAVLWGNIKDPVIWIDSLPDKGRYKTQMETFIEVVLPFLRWKNENETGNVEKVQNVC